MGKIFINAIIIVILSGSFILTLSETSAQEFSPSISTKENTPPPLARNPFLDIPQGRISESTNWRGRITEMNIRKVSKKPKKIDDVIKNLHVRGVLLNRNDTMALLGRRVVKIGDMIGEFMVINITRAGVTLSNGDRIIELSLE